LSSLASSVDEIGLLHPIVVRSDGTLIAGERRLRAAQQLGWKTIPVTVVNLEAVARGEYAENAHRKDFTLSEAVAIKRALEPAERAAAPRYAYLFSRYRHNDKWDCRGDEAPTPHINRGTP
jgi:ParB/RepB/Spo0J family partition protein